MSWENATKLHPVAKANAYAYGLCPGFIRLATKTTAYDVNHIMLCTGILQVFCLRYCFHYHYQQCCLKYCFHYHSQLIVCLVPTMFKRHKNRFVFNSIQQPLDFNTGISILDIEYDFQEYSNLRNRRINSFCKAKIFPFLIRTYIIYLSYEFILDIYDMYCFVLVVCIC